MDPGTRGCCSPGGSGKPGAFSEAMKYGHNPGLKLLLQPAVRKTFYIITQHSHMDG